MPRVPRPHNVLNGGAFRPGLLFTLVEQLKINLGSQTKSLSTPCWLPMIVPVLVYGQDTGLTIGTTT
jgi:hypothetical protein